MSSATEAVVWKESVQELHARYEAERDVEARNRLGALWLLRDGESVGNAAQTAGVGSAHAHSLGFLVQARGSRGGAFSGAGARGSGWLQARDALVRALIWRNPTLGP